MSDLRSKVIRLAHEKPELRGHLLPLLKESSQKMLQLFPRTSWEWNYMLSDGSMGVGEAEDLIGSLKKDTGLSEQDIKALLKSGKEVAISDRLFRSLKSWSGRSASRHVELTQIQKDAYQLAKTFDNMPNAYIEDDQSPHGYAVTYRIPKSQNSLGDWILVQINITALENKIEVVMDFVSATNTDPLEEVYDKQHGRYKKPWGYEYSFANFASAHKNSMRFIKDFASG